MQPIISAIKKCSHVDDKKYLRAFLPRTRYKGIKKYEEERGEAKNIKNCE